MNNVLSIEINGVKYAGFTSAEITKSLKSMCSKFAFEISVLNDLSKFPIKKGSECRVLVNNKTVITGFVEKISIAYSASDHRITIYGRDKTCDIVDSTLGSDITITAGISLQEIINKVLSYLGLTDKIKVFTDEEIEVFSDEDINNIATNYGETAFEFIARYATKRQVLIITDGDGNIRLVRKPKDSEVLNTTLVSGSQYMSNILSAEIDYDDTNRFYKYIFASQANPNSGEKVTGSVITDISQISSIGKTTEKAVNVKTTALDEDIRQTRIYNSLQNNDAYNNINILKDRANFEANFRRAKGFNYKVTVQGFTPEKDLAKIWEINQLVNIRDDYCDVSPGVMLLNEVVYSQSVDSGSKTTLSFIDKDGYSTEVLQGLKYKQKKEKQKTGQKISKTIKDINQLNNL